MQLRSLLEEKMASTSSSTLELKTNNKNDDSLSIKSIGSLSTTSSESSAISESPSEMETFSDFMAFTECDATLVDDPTTQNKPKNEAEMMFNQVMDVLRIEQEVCFYLK